ncbi:MAG TPA: nuclear transport factor 2 family protein [Variovorax sp.]|jgi:ketosteroid isomerase-like protein|nr:nuclear transport factor 2 family protein [Variovorax sp.]
MTEEESNNVALLKKGYALWNQSKADCEGVSCWMALLSDDVQWRSLAAGAAGMEFTRACRSKDEVQNYFQELGKDWELLSYDANEFIAQGDRVVMLGSCEWKHRGTGKIVKSPKADVHRLRDGKVVDFMEFYDTAGALAAAG